MAVYETSVRLATTAEQLFDFLSRPDHAVDLAPPGTTVKLLSAPDVLDVGRRVEFDVSGYGPTHRFVHEVTAFERPSRISVKQVRGPFKAFLHDAVLQSDGNGGVELVDRIEFQPPGGLAGFLLTEARIRRMFEEGYEHRHAELREMFARGEPPE